MWVSVVSLLLYSYPRLTAIKTLMKVRCKHKCQIKNNLFSHDNRVFSFQLSLSVSTLMFNCLGQRVVKLVTVCHLDFGLSGWNPETARPAEESVVNRRAVKTDNNKPQSARPFVSACVTGGSTLAESGEKLQDRVQEIRSGSEKAFPFHWNNKKVWLFVLYRPTSTGVRMWDFASSNRANAITDSDTVRSVIQKMFLVLIAYFHV